jgi:pre-mRNA-processing factor 6
MLAAQKEDDPKVKSKVLRRALEHLPTDEDIWKELVGLED